VLGRADSQLAKQLFHLGVEHFTRTDQYHFLLRALWLSQTERALCILGETAYGARSHGGSHA